MKNLSPGLLAGFFFALTVGGGAAAMATTIFTPAAPGQLATLTFLYGDKDCMGYGIGTPACSNNAAGGFGIHEADDPFYTDQPQPNQLVIDEGEYISFTTEAVDLQGFLIASASGQARAVYAPQVRHVDVLLNGFSAAALPRTDIPLQHFRMQQFDLLFAAATIEDIFDSGSIELGLQSYESAPNHRAEFYIDYIEVTLFLAPIPEDTDSDGDGLGDPAETDTGIFVSQFDTGTDPLNPDSDGDGAGDGIEVFTYGTDPNTPDPDSDSDSVPDVADNCLEIPNPDQADANNSEDDNSSIAGIQSYGDLCDGDINNDGSIDGIDFAAYFLPCFIKGIVQSFPECATSDFDGDEFVTGADFSNVFLPQFVVGTPGP